MRTEIIFKNAHYTACTIDSIRDGLTLCVTSNRTGKGAQLVGENAPVWIDNIKDAIDTKEASMLCKAVVGNCNSQY